MDKLPIKKVLKDLKIRSEKGNNQSKDLRIIETSLVPCSPAIRPDLFKKQILMLNESKLITEIMSDHREIKSIVRISREDPELILDEISLLIIGVQNFLDTKRKMDENGIVEVAGLILSEYPFLTWWRSYGMDSKVGSKENRSGCF